MVKYYSPRPFSEVQLRCQHQATPRLSPRAQRQTNGRMRRKSGPPRIYAAMPSIRARPQIRNQVPRGAFLSPSGRRKISHWIPSIDALLFILGNEVPEIDPPTNRADRHAHQARHIEQERSQIWRIRQGHRTRYPRDIDTHPLSRHAKLSGISLY